MNKPPIEVLRDFVERAIHWEEGGADRHAALKEALPALEKQLAASGRLVGELHVGHATRTSAEHWCREVLMYSPGNPGDRPETRVKVYTGGDLGEALERIATLEKRADDWRLTAEAHAKHLEASRATSRLAIGFLQAVLNKPRTHAEQQAADTAARDWLISIGSEPS